MNSKNGALGRWGSLVVAILAFVVVSRPGAAQNFNSPPSCTVGVTVDSRSEATLSGNVTGGLYQIGYLSCDHGGKAADIFAETAVLWYYFDGDGPQEAKVTLTTVQQGRNNSCTQSYLPYIYSYDQAVDISSLSPGQHTVTVYAVCEYASGTDTATFTVP